MLFMVELLLLLIGAFVWFSTRAHTINSLPSKEYSALYDNGKHWGWQSPYSQYGYPWNFTTPNQNPCSTATAWQGIVCSSTCETESCHIISLMLKDYGLHGTLPSSLGNLSAIDSLYLNRNRNLTGTIPVSLSTLKELRVLFLDQNRLTGTIPESIGDLNDLRSLYLDDNQLTGSIPGSLGNLSKLEVLFLHRNLLTGTIPISFGNLNYLQSLSLFENQLTGTIPSSLGDNLDLLEFLDLLQNQLTGTIPVSLSNLSSVLLLSVFQNQLTGTIPALLGSLKKVKILSLNQNLLTGTIPTTLDGLSSVEIIYLDQNQLTGTLPASLGNLKTLEVLDLYQNAFTGNIPSSFGNLMSLKFLFLYETQLSGTIPHSLSNLKELSILYLFANRLTGTIPTSLSNLTSMRNLHLYQNYLTGTIPASLGNMTRLIHLYLHENLLTGTTPASLSNLHKLEALSLNDNLLTGTLPSSVGNMTAVVNFAVYQNFLTGTIPSSISNIKRLIYLYLNQNQFTGTIPVSFGNLKALNFLSLHTNLLSGEIPSMLGELIESIYLFENLFSGKIPLQFTRLKALKQVDLSDNVLSGSLPSGLFNDTTELATIAFSKNSFSGSIPSSIFESKKLFSVILAVNCFTGTIPDSICNSPVLTQLILDGLHSASSCSENAIPGLVSSGVIAQNTVYGTVASCLLQHRELSVLHMGGNDLSGTIPNVPISGIQELVLSSNQLTGTIPETIWNSNITKLDLSLNRLQGTLASDMLPAAQLLDGINVSIILQVNQLAGTIPTWLQSLPSGNINVLEGNLFSCNLDRSNLPANDPKAGTYECGSDNTNYGLVAFVAAAGLMITFVSLYKYYTKSTSAADMILAFNKHYTDTAVSKMWQNIQNAIFMLVSMWIIGMIAFGILSTYFSAYADVYVWVISTIYKMGMSASLTMLVLFVLSLVWITWCVHFYSFSLSYNINAIGGKEFEEEEEKEGGGEKEVPKFAWVYHLCSLSAVLVINISIVVTVNVAYVYFVVSGNYSNNLLLMIAFWLSLFKIGWNYLLWRVSQYIPAISDIAIVWMCLFNNLLAPLLAEMFVSPDCFLYIISQAPSLVFNYNVYSCQLETDDYLVGEVCRLPVLFAQGYGTSVDVSIIPPFHYSYQCSFSLISSYASVFTFRYLITGIIKPTLRMIFYGYCRMFSSHGERNLMRYFLPSFWKRIVKFEAAIGNSDIFQEQLQAFSNKQVLNGMFRRQIVSLLVTDLTMLICFGALFPPLSVVITFSVLKDVVSIKLALGRYCEIMESPVLDERLKEQMIKVRESIYKEMLKAGLGIWSGVLYGMLVGAWIWGFVLFDTMASVEGVATGLYVLIGMTISPFFILYVKHAMTGDTCNKKVGKNLAEVEMISGESDKFSKTTLSPVTTEIMNPIHQ
jgi:Leucine-rich repeat (LRR) protein